MDSSLYQAAAQVAPGDGRAARLYALAVSPGAPQALAQRVRWGLMLVAALLLASGLIFWVAANWQGQSRMFRLGLIEGALALSVLAACAWPRARVPALLCATLALGGLLAYVGQTYQTGADAWQLFAVWAALSLIWVGLARSDVLWTVWVLVLATGIVTWSGRVDLWNVFFLDREYLSQLLLRMALWLGLALVPAVVSLIPWLRVNGGVAWWSHRTALGLALAAWVGIGVVQVFGFGAKQTALGWVLAGVLVAVSLLVSLYGRFQDFVAASLAALAANVLVLALVARWLADGSDLEALLLFGLIALGCLGGSVRGLIAVQQRMRALPVAGREVV